MARTLPTQGVSPIDAYSAVCDRPMGYFEAAIPAAETGEPTLKVKVTDARTAGTNYKCTGLLVDFDVTGADSKYIWGAQIDASVTGKTGGGVAALNISTSTISNPTMGYLWGIYLEMGSGGTACEQIQGMRVLLNGNDVTVGSHFFSLRKNGSATITSVIKLEVAATASYLIYCDNPTPNLPYTANPSCAAGNDYIRCYFNGVKYIRLYDPS